MSRHTSIPRLSGGQAPTKAERRDAERAKDKKKKQQGATLAGQISRTRKLNEFKGKKKK